MDLETIDAKGLKEKLDNLGANELVVDVRSAGEFAEMRIDHPAIQNIDMNVIVHQADEFKDKKLYLICNSGNRSGMVQMVLDSQGVEAVNVDGGMMLWLHNDFPTISDF